MTAAEELELGAVALGVVLSETKTALLLQFAALLSRWNRAFNLVSRRDDGRLIARHLLDALSLAPMLRGSAVLDLGTGAGLPGVPLAIAHPEVAFTLVDRSERRIRFVRQTIIELDLRNVAAVASDFVDFRPSNLFDTVVSRAVAKPAALWGVASTLLAADGIALFQVGVPERDTADLGASVQPIAVHVPGLLRPHHVLRIRREDTTHVARQDADR